MSNQRFATETKLLAIQYVEESLYTKEEVCRMFSVNLSSLSVWHTKFIVGGAEALNSTLKRPKRRLW
ncbi:MULTISPECIES: hypothetical protein [Bacilli]|uniref:hypothetical protein n=1 Tax=Bacilli TaxID=91061 RepID=UPI001966DA76|nr:hypothetical protein [Lysinibacillus fusiformis]QSB07874.1 hypothetical protein JTI58_12460 [Lysinibacillus fusiformis]